jgi:hypothetical protein
VTLPAPRGVPLAEDTTMYRKSWEDWFIIIGTLASVVALGNLWGA